MTDIRKTIAEIRKLMEKATPGPWEHACDGHIICNFTPFSVAQADVDALARDRNADLIAAMRNNLPAILDRLEALEKVSEAAREAIRGIDKWERFESIGSDRLEHWEEVERTIAELDNTKDQDHA